MFIPENTRAVEVLFVTRGVPLTLLFPLLEVDPVHPIPSRTAFTATLRTEADTVAPVPDLFRLPPCIALGAPVWGVTPTSRGTSQAASTTSPRSTRLSNTGPQCTTRTLIITPVTATDTDPTITTPVCHMAIGDEITPYLVLIL